MIKIFGELYYIDIEEVHNYCLIKQNEEQDTVKNYDTKEIYGENDNLISKEIFTHEHIRGNEINITKYEIVNKLIDIIFSEVEPLDMELGMERAFKANSIGFQLAYNTLTFYKILKKI